MSWRRCALVRNGDRVLRNALERLDVRYLFAEWDKRGTQHDSRRDQADHVTVVSRSDEGPPATSAASRARGPVLAPCCLDRERFRAPVVEFLVVGVEELDLDLELAVSLGEFCPDLAGSAGGAVVRGQAESELPP